MSARWFTDNAAAGPAEIRPVLTPFEEMHFAAILEFAHNKANHDWENLRCIDADGRRLYDMSVGYKCGPLTDKMKRAIAAKRGVRQWHNHPSQDSLSDSDWICAASQTELEILALNERGSIYVGRLIGWDERLNHVFKGFWTLGGNLESHMGSLAVQRSLDIDLQVALSRFTAHVLNLALATCCPEVRYAYAHLPAEREVLDACSALGIVEDGCVYAKAAIQKMLDEAPADPADDAGDPGTGTPIV
jgi:hypothetical protein